MQLLCLLSFKAAFVHKQTFGLWVYKVHIRTYTVQYVDSLWKIIQQWPLFKDCSKFIAVAALFQKFIPVSLLNSLKLKTGYWFYSCILYHFTQCPFHVPKLAAFVDEYIVYISAGHKKQRQVELHVPWTKDANRINLRRVTVDQRCEQNYLMRSKENKGTK